MQTGKTQITEYRFEETSKIHGVKRVLMFCLMIVILPATLIITPLYLRRKTFANVTYPVAESDIIEIRDGVSSIFCEKHSLHMDSNFNAFQLSSKPEISPNRKHIRLKKSMTLPDDTLEYWGFYLLKGARVELKFCSRYDGSRILVVKGQRNLQTCGLLDHNKNKLDANFALGHEQVKVFFEDITEIASNIPAKELEIKTKKDRDRREEAANDASEDFREGSIEVSASVSAVKAHVPNQPRKKLKKGSISRKSLLPNKLVETQSRSFTGQLSNNVNLNNYILASSLKDRSWSPAPKWLSKFSTHKTELKDIFRAKRSQIQHKQTFYDSRFAKLHSRLKRNEHVYDRKYSHGGNAVNFTETDESNSVSSFESGLFDCFNGDILLAEGFAPSQRCLNTHFLENGSHRMLSKHDITEDGYYYYIFYSDNDLVRNDIHAIFDIYKPTFQYSKLSNAQGCVNTTDCTFLMRFLSDEIVVVEIPTRDGIEHEDDDTTYLTSTCLPRTTIYAIFPVTVLILILACSFL